MIFPNVQVGEGSIIADDAIVGHPPRGASAGDLPVRIGRNAVIRSGAVIYGGVEIGDDFNSGHGALIRERNIIGSGCSVGTNAVLEPGNHIGDGTRLHSGVFLEHTTIGRRVFVAPNVTFTDDPHPICPRFEECVLGATVEDDVSIGGNATILPGVRIGERALVGAGSVVTHDIPARTVVAGNPARVVKRVDELVCFQHLFTRPYIWKESE